MKELLTTFLAATDLDSLRTTAERLISRMSEAGIFVSDEEEIEYFRACRRLSAAYEDLAGRMLGYMILNSEY